jgi:L-amino acid N-acyltransferase YncA
MSGRYQVRATTDFEWLQRRTDCAVTSDFSAIEALDAYGRTRGMVGYCGWTENSVQMHMAVTAPSVWRALLRPSLEYPFAQVGVGVCLGIIPSSNVKSLRFAGAVGFEEKYRIRDGWDVGEDLVLLEMRKEDCRFLLSNERRAA